MSRGRSPTSDSTGPRMTDKLQSLESAGAKAVIVKISRAHIWSRRGWAKNAFQKHNLLHPCVAGGGRHKAFRKMKKKTERRKSSLTAETIFRNVWKGTLHVKRRYFLFLFFTFFPTLLSPRLFALASAAGETIDFKVLLLTGEP